MIRHPKLVHRFVEDIPELLEPGVLYVSLSYATALHLCCCGCKREVVTPLSPAQWKMTFDGESVSLHPSIGSWALPCRSHYVVRRGRVVEAGQWSEEEIESGRLKDKAARSAYYASKSGLSNIDKERSTPEQAGADGHRIANRSRWLSSLIGILRGRP
jgi:hypothetical protein